MILYNIINGYIPPNKEHTDIYNILLIIVAILIITHDTIFE